MFGTSSDVGAVLAEFFSCGLISKSLFEMFLEEIGVRIKFLFIFCLALFRNSLSNGYKQPSQYSQIYPYQLTCPTAVLQHGKTPGLG